MSVCFIFRKPSIKCVKSMLSGSNSSRYFVATNQNELREKARKVPGTPVLYLHGQAPTLEKQSEASEKAAEDMVHKRWVSYSVAVSSALLTLSGAFVLRLQPKKRVTIDHLLFKYVAGNFSFKLRFQMLSRIHESHEMKRLKASDPKEEEVRGKKRKRTGNPNPLSCLKSKKKKMDPATREAIHHSFHKQS